MIERLNGRLSIAIAAAGLLLVLLVGWFGFVTPQRSKATDLAAKITATETQLALTEAVARGSQLRQSGKELVTLRVAIPDQISMPEILRQLTRAAVDGNVRITGITPAAVVSTGVAEAVPMSITVEGRYFGIREFLRHLRTRADLKGDELRASGRLFSVDSIQFAGGTVEGGGIQATLSISAFAFRGAAPAPGAVTTVPTAPPAEAAGG